MRPAVIAFALGLAVGLSLTAIASGKKSKGGTPYDAALDAQRPAVVECVMEYGIKKGAPSVQLDIRVLVNRSGQAFGTDLQVAQEGGDKNAMAACVKAALEHAKFPPSRSSLTELRRVWTFSAS